MEQKFDQLYSLLQRKLSDSAYALPSEFSDFDADRAAVVAYNLEQCFRMSAAIRDYLYDQLLRSVYEDYDQRCDDVNPDAQ